MSLSDADKIVFKQRVQPVLAPTIYKTRDMVNMVPQVMPQRFTSNVVITDDFTHTNNADTSMYSTMPVTWQ